MWKVGAGVAGLGAVAATGGTFLYREFAKPKTHLVRDLLAAKNPEKRLIANSTDGSSDEWKKAWQLYSQAYKDNGKNPFSLALEKPSTVDGNQNAPVEFMNKCAFFLNKEVLDEKDEDYRNVLQYCTRDTLVSDLITENGRSLIGESEGKEAWQKTWDDYKGKYSTKSNGQDHWTLNGWDSQKSQADAPQVFKQECTKRSKSKAHTLDNKDYQDVLHWCTKS
ncbi:hypothetical protein MHC_01170 [Mycoplasma haemocanis str. Illinois]|uniref:Uncharacterized protein n=1 Tax=Mycoplasma haemocanis (strain Illinois) TaxID=1111676 RepID=H6N628_MYCHN|nr:hypothetical protein [Mycoplasma haemocanis]AEW45100.1 hypothetical protein MHC_01170 [Mycoplasma haemocanis str. Illinois]